MERIETQLCDRCIDLLAGAGYEVRIDANVPKYRRRMKCANCSAQSACRVRIDRDSRNITDKRE